MTEKTKGPQAPKPPLVIITGLSGAGKSTAMRVFEDLGCYCVDNLPPGLISDFYDLYLSGDVSTSGVVIASDVRSGALFTDLAQAVTSLKDQGASPRILFLDSSNHVLMNRYNEVRRSHPLQAGRSMKEAIEEERRRLEPIREIADYLIDTSDFGTPQLREAIVHTMVGEDPAAALRLRFVSFGFKYGAPRDADFVLDVRFLPNPFYEPALREGTGEDQAVYDYVMAFDEASSFFERAVQMLSVTFESFIKVGKHNLNVAVGCTGGRHRSVAFARRLGEHFEKTGSRTKVVHRDLSRPLS